jgi:hypothetical protein
MRSRIRIPSRVPVKTHARGLRPFKSAPWLYSVCLLVLAAAGAAHPRNAQSAAPALPHDSHDGFTIAADPYSSAGRAQAKFGKDNPFSAGILPIDVFLTNDSGAAMRVQLESIRFEVSKTSGQRQELEPLSVDQTAELIAFPLGAGVPSDSSPRLPLPIPHHSKKADKIVDNLRPLALDADVIAPHATIHGFLFFNVSGEFYLLPKATLYVPDVRAIAGSHALTFFEVMFHTTATP